MTATVWRTRDEPLAVRNGRGPLHLAVPGTTAGGNSRAGVTDRYLAACRRTLRGAKVTAIPGEHAQWLLEDEEARWCPDCVDVMEEADCERCLWAVTGW